MGRYHSENDCVMLWTSSLMSGLSTCTGHIVFDYSAPLFYCAVIWDSCLVCLIVSYDLEKTRRPLTDRYGRLCRVPVM